MAHFKYRGRSGRGDLISGMLEAVSADAVASQLLTSGITPIDIIEGGSSSSVWSDFKRRFVAGRPTISELILFSRQMHTLIRAGVPITRGMASLVESTRNPVFADVLRDIQANLESGRDVASSLARHPRVFSSLFISMVRVGETTGRLDQAFLQVTDYLELDKETRDRIKTATRYPIIVFIALFIAMGIMNVLVIPEFAKIFASSNLELPWQTQAIVAVSDFTIAYWPLVVLALVVMVVSIRVYVATEAGRYTWDKLKLRIPIVGKIIHRAIMARFSRSFAITLAGGVPLIQALTVVSRAVDNEYVGDHILNMRNGIERGEGLTRVAMTTGLFTPPVLQMMAVGEETGSVDELLSEIAGFYEREVDYDLKYLGDAIQPVLLVAIAGMVLVLILGVILPVWDLAAGVGN